jgi:SAM-dependent methyltransferase
MRMLSLDPRRLLAHPVVYGAFIRLIGCERGRTRYATEIVRARPGDRVLDIGCGPADVLEYLPDVEYHGFDMSPAYIEHVRRRFGHRGSFYCRRVSGDAIDDLGEFDLVTATGVLHHLSDEEAVTTFELAHRALKPGGRFVSCDGCYVPGQGLLTRLILTLDRGAYVRTRESYVGLANVVFRKVSALIRGDLTAIPYTHIVLECTR